MRRRMRAMRVGLLLPLLACAFSLPVYAADAPALSSPPGLSILEIKVTGSEFVVLQNNSGTDITDLGSYALYYFNNYNPFAKDVSSSTAFLPDVALGNGQSLLLSGDPRPTCGAAIAGNLGLSLGDSSGFLEIVKLSSQNGAVAQQAGDVVSWNSGGNGIIQNVPSNTKDPAAMWYRIQIGQAYGWQYAQVDASKPCQLNAVMTSGTTKTNAPVEGLLANTDEMVPGTIVSLATPEANDSGPSSVMPVADIGLKAPKVSELLPDVASPGSDDTDEFIELYNPNDRAFDLSGFTLQAGSMTSDTRHNYTFPTGNSIPAKGFKAFYSAQTGISLNNSGGQVWLLDPFGTSVAQSDPYGKPKAGAAWATVNGKWYFTTVLTPNAANSIKMPPTSSTSKTSKSTAKTSKGTPVTAVNLSGAALGGSTNAPYADAAQTVPIHPLTLAVVGALALLYGAYEYRLDLANYYRRLRGNRSTRP